MTAPFRTALLAVLAAVPLALVLAAGAPRDAATYSSGSPGGFAGDNRDQGVVRTCTTCHATYAPNSGTGSVRIDAPSGVAPGQTVAVTVTVDNTTPPAPGATRRQGFEAIARDARGAVAGRLATTDASTRKTFGADESVTHTVTGNTRTSWTFNWTAPDAPAEVTFYAAGNAANGGDVGNNGDNSAGDYIYTTTRTVRVGATPTADAPDAARPLTLGAPHPNPARRETTVRLSLADATPVRVRLVDGRGRTVRVAADGHLGAGERDVTVRTAGLAPGLYVVVAEAGGRHVARPVVVVR